MNALIPPSQRIPFYIEQKQVRSDLNTLLQRETFAKPNNHQIRGSPALLLRSHKIEETDAIRSRFRRTVLKREPKICVVLSL